MYSKDPRDRSRILRILIPGFSGRDQLFSWDSLIETLCNVEDEVCSMELLVTNQTLVTNCLEHCLEAFGCEVKHMWSFLISNPDSCVAILMGERTLQVGSWTLLASWGPLRKGTWWPWLQFNLPAHLSPCQCQVWKASFSRDPSYRSGRVYQWKFCLYVICQMVSPQISPSKFFENF